MGIYLLITLGAYLAICFVLARGYVMPQRNPVVRPSELVATEIGGNPAWVTASEMPETVVVMGHGYGGDRQTWTELMPALERAGIGAIAPAMPGQEESTYGKVGFGLTESKVLAEAGRWARAKGAKTVVGMGLSMGGAAAWLATQGADQPFDGVISDAAFPIFEEAMLAFLDRAVPAGGTTLRPVIWFARAMTGIDPATIRPIDAARAWKGRPALVIQGTADHLFPISYGERLAEAAGCPMWRIEGADHAATESADPKAYARRVVAFVKAIK